MTTPNNASTSDEHKESLTLKDNYKIDKLKMLCLNNAEYFSKDSSENGQRLYISCRAMIDAIDLMWPKLLIINNEAPAFDFDESTPGNGYRSFLQVIKLAINLSLNVNEKVLQKREGVLFRKHFLTKDLEACSHLLTTLDVCLNHLQLMLSWCEDGNLFLGDSHSPEELFAQCGEINQHCFYGRNLGFQYCESIKNVMQFIALSMTLFSEVYYADGSLITKATNSFMSTTKYITDPEQRAKRIVNISRNAEVDFCKAFWFLSETELMNQLPSIVSPSVAISKVLHLPPEPITVTTVDGEQIEVPVPSSHIGKKHIQVRFISYKMREGMIGSKDRKGLEPPSKDLIIHCHGGGFVAQSSKSHEGYLRDWAKHLDVPILCIDYSLAPEAPFPRALEEIFYTYCWARNNHTLLGTTAENIVGAGDSAGANLILTTTLRCIQMKVPTFKGIFVAYAPTGVHFRPSPARLLCMMDPLLPFGFLMRCLKAYACTSHLKQGQTSSGNTSDTESFEEISESDIMELQAHKSPVSETSDTLTYGSLTDNDDNNTTVVDLNASDIEKSQKCMTELLEKFALDSDTDTDGTKSTTVIKGDSTTSSINDDSIYRRVFSFVSSLKTQLTQYLGERSLSRAEKILDIDDDIQSSIVDKFLFTVPKDPYLSPDLASDEDLKMYPPTRILSVHLDPCLDDCVMFAKRLKMAGNNVKLDILPGLPHGFLNFSLFSKEAYEGSRLCADRIQELLNLQQ